MLIANYMEEFKCTGSDCPDSCCNGWQVTLDRKTYKQYKKSNHSKLKPTFQNHIGRIRNSTKSENNYAYIKLDKNNACPFLTAESLCSVQNNLGESALSPTCSTYPRIYNLIDGTLEKSATLSCPEAARLALLQENGISFTETQDDNCTDGMTSIGMQIDTLSATSKNDISAYFWDLHLFSIEMLQNRKFQLWQRLLTLGFVTRKISDLAKEGNRESIPQIIEQYRQKMDEAPTSIYEKEIPAKQNTQLSLIQVLLKDAVKNKIRNKRFLECHQLFLQGISDGQSLDNSEIQAKFSEAYLDFYSPLMKKYHYLLENYLVNYVFRTLFPVSVDTDAQEAYTTLVINYTIIRTYLIGMAGALKEDFNTEHVLLLIQSFSKVIEHDKNYTQTIRQFLRDNNFDQLAHMAVLLRNQDNVISTPMTVEV